MKKYLFFLFLIINQLDVSAQWSRVTNSIIPSNALRAGNEANGTPLYIARANYEGGLHVGKANSGEAYIPYGGREVYVQNYEVYTGTGTWIRISNGNFPQNAIVGGREADGTPLYIARAAIEGGIHIGKAKASNEAWISYGGVERYFANNFEVLVGSNSTRVMTRFNPSVHGFRFRNDFVTNFAGIDFSGLCGGMAYSALDYFNNNIPVPTQTSPPANGTPLRQYIYNRQQNATLDNVDKWGELSFNPFGSRTNEFFNWGLQGSNGGRVQELRAEIDAGRPVPLGLYKGGNGGFVYHHQVLAIGYDMGRYTGNLGEFKEDFKIYVYDSNFPRQIKVLRPNISDPRNPRYVYESDPSCAWLTYFVDKKYRLASPPR